MKVQEVFETVLSLGCGIDFADLLNSEAYKNRLEAACDLSNIHSPESDLGIALRAGYWLFGSALNSGTEAEALAKAKEMPPQPHNPKHQVLMQIVGEALVKAATDCLPPKAVEIAQSWQDASAEEQIVLCDQLYDCLYHASPGLTWEDDVADQPNERVLPKAYGRWGEGVMPNCIGKCELLAAFARLAGAKTLAVAPIRATDFHYHAKVAEASRKVLREMDLWDKMPTTCKTRNHEVDPVREMFEAPLRFYEEISELPDRSHLAVALQLKDGRWHLVDPNLATCGIFDANGRITEIASLLDKYSAVLPGLTIQAEDSAVDTFFKPHFDRFEHIFQAAATFAVAYRKARIAPKAKKALERCQEMFERSDALQILLKRAWLPPHYKGATLFEKARWIMWSEYGGLEDGWKIIESQQKKYNRKERRMSDANVAEGYQQVVDGLALVPVTLYTQGKLEIEFDAEIKKRGLVYPQAEFGNLEYMIATMVLSFVGINLDRAEEIEQFLRQEVFEQYRLLYAASAPLTREDETPSPIEAEAARILETLPFRLNTADWCLRELEQLAMKGGD